MPNPNNQTKFTGIVIMYNEEKRLRDCLSSLAFCDQLLVVDLGSKDSSVRIAKQCGAEVIRHNWVPIVEQIREKALTFARNEWIIFLDPDEVFPAGVEVDLGAMIRRDTILGLIKIPWRFYFKGKPLHYTIWGLKRPRGAYFINTEMNLALMYIAVFNLEKALKVRF